MASCSIMYMQQNAFKMKEKKLDISAFLYILIMITVFVLGI